MPDVVMEIYKYNPEWTTEQINEAAMGRFNKFVAKRGIDTSKPFESEGGVKDPEQANKAFADEIRSALGLNKD